MQTLESVLLILLLFAIPIKGLRFFTVLIYDRLSLFMSLSSYESPTNQFLLHRNVEKLRDYL